MNENRFSRGNGDAERHAPRLDPTRDRNLADPAETSLEDSSYGSAATGFERSGYSGAGSGPAREEHWRADEGARYADEDAPRYTGDSATRSPESVTTLLRSLAGDAVTITRKEIALARSEVSKTVSELRTGLVASATGGGVLFAGLLFLLLAATLGLATVMAGWLAALIVGGVVFLIGMILVGTGKKKLEAENFRPDRTVDAMQKDQEMIKRRATR